MDNLALGFSLLVCTYNPNEQVFRRTLKPIQSLVIPVDTPAECIIVDNNSSTPAIELSYVQEFIWNCPWTKVIKETQQGLFFARVAAFQAAKNSINLLYKMLYNSCTASRRFAFALSRVLMSNPIAGSTFSCLARNFYFLEATARQKHIPVLGYYKYGKGIRLNIPLNLANLTTVKLAENLIDLLPAAWKWRVAKAFLSRGITIIGTK